MGGGLHVPALLAGYRPTKISFIAFWDDSYPAAMATAMLLLADPSFRDLSNKWQPEPTQAFLCVPPSSESRIYRHPDRDNDQNDPEKDRETEEQVEEQENGEEWCCEQGGLIGWFPHQIRIRVIVGQAYRESEHSHFGSR